MALAGGLLLGEKAGAKELDPGMPMPHTKAPGAGRKIAMRVHPRMALLDLIGPQTILNIRGCDIYLVAKTLVGQVVGVDGQPLRHQPSKHSDCSNGNEHSAYLS